MKFFCRASSIARLTALFLSACDSLGIRDILAPDQVPQMAKDEPRIVAAPPPVAPETPWPRLGDVPFKPNDFSTKPVYDHYMDELTDDRIGAEADKKEVDQAPVFSPVNGLTPPQLPTH